MFPILYEDITSGVVPQHNGIGVLSDCISCVVEQERNGAYELTLEYPLTGIHAEEIAYRRIIKAKPNYTDDPQLFRIDNVGKVMNGKFTVYAKHISYDLSGFEITSGTASSASAACLLLQNNASGYTITTDKTATGNFKITEPSSVRSWFAGKSGSFLDVFGTAEIKYNNFNIQFLLHAGADRGVTIRYKKNLLELSQEIDSSNLYTDVICFYKDNDGNITLSSKVSTGLTLDVSRCLVLDVSADYDETPTTQQLTSKATAYINNNNLTIPTNNITLDFVQSGELQDRVDLCDTVNIYYEALGITRASMKCIRTKWDCLRGKYIETEFGDAITDFTDAIIATNKAVSEKPTTSYMEFAIRNATQLITGNLGGYVVLHDNNGDGEPDEILVMDTPDIQTATKVWRWNKNGLGYSSSGYDGTYGLAMTSDGAIVADFITAGTMSGNRVRTGLISSTNNQLQIDLDNGTITAPSITLNGEDVGSKLAELEQVSVVTSYALSNSGTVIPSSFPLSQPTQPTESQPYLWSRTIYTYADGDENISYGVSVRGANGQDGQDGKSFTVKGTYNTMADLIAAHPTGEEGDAYMVAGDLVVWNVDTNSWEDVGRIQGPSGFDGLWLAVENDDTGSNTNITYTARLFKGVTDVTSTYNAVFVWQMVKESGVTEIAANTATVTVTRDSADYGGAIRCICVCIITEENLEDYSYAAIQDYSGNDIQIIGSNIVKLIGDTAIYKPYAIESKFQVLSDEISSKVTQTEFNSLEDTVTQQGTLIQQNSQQILLKADTTTVNNALNGKMAKDMSNRSSSILIDSGQIRFDSNSIVVNSSQFTLDAQGNATFGGNITGASLNIGGSSVGIGTAIDNAETGAVQTASADATSKANAAVQTAAADATDKANAAKNAAITSATQTAATDATNKANAARDAAVATASADATTKANNAAKTATNYITRVDSNGIYISPESQNPTSSAQGNSVLLNGSGLNVYKGSASVASFGDTARIGKTNSSRFLINATSIQAYNSSNAKYFEVSANGITFGTNTVASTSYADSKASTAQSNAVATAKNYTDTETASAKTYAAGQATNALNSAKDYTDQAETDAVATAKTYTDGAASTAQSNAVATAKSYTDTGLSGKVGNSEVRTKFAADNHSVTIQSGTIGFASNTLSIDSTNFQLTTNGTATATNFRAKERFSLLNANNVEKYYVTHNLGEGTTVAVKNEDNDVCALMQSTATGGQFRIKDDNDNSVGLLAADSSYSGKGRLTLSDGSSSHFDATPDYLYLNTTRIRLYSGYFILRDSGGTTKVYLLEGSNGGCLYLYNNSGNATISAFTASDNCGHIYIGNGSSNKIFLHGDTGEVNCVKVRQTGGLTSLYNGSLTSGSTTFSAAFSAFVIVGSVKSGGSKVTSTIPVDMLSSSDTAFQIADNDDYVSFKLKVSGTTATMTFNNRSTTGAIERVYGML